jgi:hypothetical protein
MTTILVGTSRGCFAYSEDGEQETELGGRLIWALAPDGNGACLAVVDGNEIWRRRRESAAWSLVAKTDAELGSVAAVGREIFAGSIAEAAILRVLPDGRVQYLPGFEKTPGRSEWFPQGPPLHVRALTTTTDGGILAAVHVGGIPRSDDGGKTWKPTVPVAHDVHEVRAHESFPLAAAAAAVGLCLSEDGGRTWRVMANGLGETGTTEALAVAVLYDEVLFSAQAGGAFAERSQIWRWKLGADRVELVRDGLPEWLKGKVDTNHIAAGRGRAAVVDKGGDLWASKTGSTGWTRVADGLQDAFCVMIL